MPDHNNKICLKQVTLVAITSVKLMNGAGDAVQHAWNRIWGCSVIIR